MKKKIIIAILILIIAFVLIIPNLNLERKSGTVIHPFEASFLEKLVANVSQLFKINQSKKRNDN